LSCSPLPYRPNVFAFRPQFFVDISSTINTKLEAIRCYISQYEKFGRENLIGRIKSLAQVYGWAMGYEFAESFEVIRMDDSLWM
jgi:LmbE family N-acetylglucosaminyl deacetylase